MNKMEVKVLWVSDFQEVSLKDGGPVFPLAGWNVDVTAGPQALTLVPGATGAFYSAEQHNRMSCVMSSRAPACLLLVFFYMK